MSYLYSLAGFIDLWVQLLHVGWTPTHPCVLHAYMHLRATCRSFPPTGVHSNGVNILTVRNLVRRVMTACNSY